MNGPSIPDVYQIFVKAVSLFPAFTLNDVNAVRHKKFEG